MPQLKIKRPNSTHITIRTIRSVSSFLALCEQIKKTEQSLGNAADFLFRGQCTDEPLIPKIARLNPKGALRNTERLMMAEFERQRLPFTEFDPANEWDALALAQHHGLPTRLLDWSYSALAALWFCVSSQPQKDSKRRLLNGVVWLLKTDKNDFINFPTNETPFTKGCTRIFRPRSVSKRIMAQAGVFTCHKRTTAGKFIALEKNKNYKKRLIKIVIPAVEFRPLREQLNACGVNSLSMFPDLGGLASHLRFRYFH